MQKILLILFILLLAQIAGAKEFNNGVIKGSLHDEHNTAVPFATIILKNSNDSSFYKGELSNEAGAFIFEMVKEGNYFAEIKVVGYQALLKENIVVSAAGPLTDLGTIVLPALAQNLQTVTIQAEKPFIERQADRTVVNIENSIVQTGSSVLEVMEKLPGVQVNQDGLISLKGKQGVSVMMDGKPTVLSGQDLANMLRGTSSASIQKIEIITNPSAKYDASGNSGIINIVSKKNKREGFNGSINGGYGQGRYEKYNSGFNLSLKEKKYNLFMSYNYSHRKGFNNLQLTRNFYNKDTLNTIFETDNYIIFPFNTHNPRLGADFYLSKKTTLAVLGTGVVNYFSPSATNHTDILDGNKTKTSSYDFTNRSTDKWYNYALNTQLKHQFDTTGKELTADLDYASYWNNTDQLFSTTTNNANGDFINRSILVGDQDGALKIYSVKADYTQPLKELARFEAGAKSSYVTADNNIKFYNSISENLVFDSTRSNHFIYSENINAAYVNYNREFKELSLQLGVRSEQTVAHGEQLLSGKKFNRNYIQVFPSVFFDYKISDKHGINLSAGRRIDRPAYQQMNPFRRLIDATTYAEGNPYLLPQLSYNTELTYSYNNIFFATFGYSLTTNNITDVLVQDGAKKVTVQTIVNLNQLNYYNINLVYSKRLSKWWTTNTSVLSYYGIYSGTINNYNINQGTPSFVFTTNNSFSIADGLSAEAGFNYTHPNLYGVTMMKYNNNLTLGLQKSVFKKLGSVTVNVSDLFWRAYPRGITNFGNVNETWSAKRDTRVVNVSFNYRFGKGQAFKMRRNTGADDEKQRTGVGS